MSMKLTGVLSTGVLALAAVALGSLVHPRVAAATPILAPTAFNFDFSATEGVPDSSYGAAAGQAGVWNITPGGVTPLYDLSNHALPGASLTVSSSAFMSGHIDGPDFHYTGGDLALIQDNFYTIGAAWDVSLAGIVNGSYDLYVYAPRDAAVPTSSFLVNGVAQTNLSHLTFAGSPPLEEGVDYEIVKLLVSNNSIDIASGADRDIFSGLAGLQLVPVAAAPIPNSLLLFGSALGLLGLVTWRRNSTSVFAG